MKRRLPAFPTQALQHLGLLIALVLIVASKGFAATRPGLTALLIFAFSLPYLFAALVTRRAHFLYGTMLLGAVSYFLTCYAFGAPSTAFPLLSVPLVVALLIVGHCLKRRLPDHLSSFPRTVFRAMHITVVVFSVWALSQASDLMSGSGFLQYVPGLTFLGYAGLYLAHCIAGAWSLHAYVFAASLALGASLSAVAVWSTTACWVATLLAAAATLFVGTESHRRKTYRWSRHFYFSAAAGLAVSLVFATVDWTFFLYNLALVSLISWIAYGRLVAAVGDIRRALMAERVVAKYLFFATLGLSIPLVPLVFVRPGNVSIAATALAFGIIFAWVAGTRRAGGPEARNVYVLPALLFLSAGLMGLTEVLPWAAASAAAALIVPLVLLAGMGLLYRALDVGGDRTTRRALAEAAALPAFFAWYVPLLGGNVVVALVGAALALGGVVALMRGLKSTRFLYAAGPAAAGAFTSVTLLTAGFGTAAWIACAAGAVAAGVTFALTDLRQRPVLRGAANLAWLILTVAAIAVSTVSGAAHALVAVTAVGTVAALVAGYRGRGEERDAFDRLVGAAAILLSIVAVVMGPFSGLGPAGAGLCLLVLAASHGWAWRWSRWIWHARFGAGMFALGALLSIFARSSVIEVRLLGMAVVVAALFGLAAVARRRFPLVASSLVIVGHATSMVAGAAALVQAWPAHTTRLPWAALPFVALYAFTPGVRGRPGSRFGAAAWLSFAGLFALVTLTSSTYREQAPHLAAMGVFWLLLGYGLSRSRGRSWAVPLYICSAMLAIFSGLLGLWATEAGTAWRVFVLNGLVFALLFFVLRQDIFAYLLTVSLALMAYDWSKSSTSMFTQDVLFYLVIGTVVLGVFFLMPHLMRLIQRLGGVPLFSVFTWRGAAFLSVPVLGLGLVVLSVYSVKITEHPKFCTSCHYMGEYYDSWQHSSHQDVACVKCHYEPGIEAKLEGKMAGMVQLMKYVSHSYDNKPHALIANRSCMRMGCHSDMDHSKEALLFRGRIKFRHEKHLSGHPRGKELNCVSCHGQVVEGQHISVTETTCLTCHFYGRDKKSVAAGECRTCHVVPETSVTFMDQEFHHRDFIGERDSVRCVDCHSGITEGDGRVSQTRCQSCHRQKTVELEDQENFHLVHVSEGHFDCLQCHDEIRHGSQSMTQQLLTSQKCNACHGGGRHSIQDRIYAGTAVAGLEATPDVMFKAGVACDGCHTDVKSVRIGKSTLTSHVSGAKQCASCHDDTDYGEMLTEWQDEVKERLGAIRPKVKELDARCGSTQATTEQLAKAKQLLESIRTNVSHVVHDGSFGAHNYEYTSMILDQVDEDLEACEALVPKPEPAADDGETDAPRGGDGE